MQDAQFEKRWSMPGVYGSERVMMQKVASAISRINPGESRLDDMMTVIAEAFLNAIEHGNQSDHSLQVTLQLIVDREKYIIRIFDHGSREPVIPGEAPLSMKWKADHPRGWGLFLINRLADRVTFGKLDGSVYIEILFNRLHFVGLQQLENKTKRS
ncbi:ATP-binding protein [Paenibacillus alkaliterrae]|uniref:ATP-binding protein n=1 Tax=Paenibacillus alkaliterrae TaxID=320909 RepID=UPI001F2D1AD0|nr:ATP-binding protein [Paenibacillus alkaliterrae]MCF2939401.1 ATP-binding protein [Paenibacillus alkaliterrae]